MEYHTSMNNVDFNSVNWVELVNNLGIDLGDSNMPVLLQMLDDEQRFSKATALFYEVMHNPKLPKGYVRDVLDHHVSKQEMTTFDKAWIVYHVNRLKRDVVDD